MGAQGASAAKMRSHTRSVTRPLALSPQAVWKAQTALWVAEPNTPSAVPAP